jgi:hypothetical protein
MSRKNTSAARPWIFIHLGARAHYQFPEALSVQIHTMYTDIWVPPNSLSKILSLLPVPLLKKILQRHNVKIDKSRVVSFPFSLLLNEIKWKLKGIKGWDKIQMRNEWFQKKVTAHLLKANLQGSYVIFAFAYTASDVLKLAQSKGWKNILYQMDPGVEEEKIIKQEMKQSSFPSSWQPAPESYWEQWKNELKLAEHILVNSAWSRSALRKSEVPDEKIKILPLALEENKEAENFIKKYPEKFTPERPLKILFLGSLTIRKGLIPLLEAIELLRNEPIEFTFVGSPETRIQTNPKVKVINSVSRADTAGFYKKADIFLFPTLSDGFGLTQLEAFSWKLPVISSSFCGEVVEDHKNGLVLEKVTAEEIKKALIYCLQNPIILQSYSDNTVQRLREFSMTKLAEGLLSISEEITSSS